MSEAQDSCPILARESEAVEQQEQPEHQPQPTTEEAQKDTVTADLDIQKIEKVAEEKKEVKTTEDENLVTLKTESEESETATEQNKDVIGDASSEVRADLIDVSMQTEQQTGSEEAKSTITTATCDIMDKMEASAEKSSAEANQSENKSEATIPKQPATETPEVSSTKDDEPAPKTTRSSSSSGRRPSYNSSRGYAGGYQNYGLTYLPYKSNFEPSEDARRKADEFFKTLKL